MQLLIIFKQIASFFGYIALVLKNYMAALYFRMLQAMLKVHVYVYKHKQ